MFRKRILILFFFAATFCRSQNNNSALLQTLLKEQSGIVKKVWQQAKKFRIQIIYTQINRDKLNRPSFITHTFEADSNNYFYCASLVKLPVSILALQKLNELNIPGLNQDTRMTTDSVIPCHKKVDQDTSSLNGFPSIGQYIRRMLLVSDNGAYGRVYEFVSPDYIHGELMKKGYPDVRIVNRYDGGCKESDHLFTNPINFYDEKNTVIFSQPAIQGKNVSKISSKKFLIGKAWLNNAGKKFNEPKDFSNYNFMTLQGTHELLKNLVFQPYTPSNNNFRITASDRKFLLNYMCLYPRESHSPRYNSKDYYDSYKKYLIYGNNKNEITDTTVRIFNIVGQSYGFLSDCAYIIDFKNKIEFLLSAVIYVNEDEIINDGKYEYRSIGLPYLSELGKIILEYDRKRKREFTPNLNEFRNLD